MSTTTTSPSIHLRGFTLPLTKTLLMGVVNVTPDSFSDGGQFLEADHAVRQAKQLIEDGADLIDVGAESSRPGSDPVSEEEEWRRLRPVLEPLLAEGKAPLSVDTCKPAVAERALALGVHVLNDITGLRDEAMVEAVARHGAAVVIMHMKGTPKTMQQEAHYDDVVDEVKRFLERQARKAAEAGIRDIILDPGIGFGKTVDHNLEILRRLNEFRSLGYPVLVGPSRKSFIGHITGAPAGQRVEGTLAALTAAVLAGAQIIRVHDVKPCKQAAQVADAIRDA